MDFIELEKINSDIVGWISIDGTQINYPIVKGKNNSYYLNRSFDKTWNSYGSIFMDYKSSSDFGDYNTFIYGHHTKNGSMFGELYKYMDIKFYEEHPYFYLYSKTESYKVYVFSAYLDKTTSPSYDRSYKTIDEYKEYLDLIISKSKYKTDVNVNYENDKIITLYSCSHENNRSKDDRYFVHGLLKK